MGFSVYRGGDGKKINKPDYAQAKRSLGDMIDKIYDLDGTKVPLKLTLSKVENNGTLLIILDKNYQTKGRNTGGGERYIAVKHLKKGKYKLRVENLKPFTELTDRPIKFKIQSTYRK